jgi:hypothetical protein
MKTIWLALLFGILCACSKNEPRQASTANLSESAIAAVAANGSPSEKVRLYLGLPPDRREAFLQMSGYLGLESPAQVQTLKVLADIKQLGEPFDPAKLQEIERPSLTKIFPDGVPPVITDGTYRVVRVGLDGARHLLVRNENNGASGGQSEALIYSLNTGAKLSEITLDGSDDELVLESSGASVGQGAWASALRFVVNDAGSLVLAIQYEHANPPNDESANGKRTGVDACQAKRLPIAITPAGYWGLFSAAASMKALCAITDVAAVFPAEDAKQLNALYLATSLADVVDIDRRDGSDKALLGKLRAAAPDVLALYMVKVQKGDAAKPLDVSNEKDVANALSRASTKLKTAAWLFSGSPFEEQVAGDLVVVENQFKVASSQFEQLRPDLKYSALADQYRKEYVRDSFVVRRQFLPAEFTTTADYPFAYEAMSMSQGGSDPANPYSRLVVIVAKAPVASGPGWANIVVKERGTTRMQLSPNLGSFVVDARMYEAAGPEVFQSFEKSRAIGAKSSDLAKSLAELANLFDWSKKRIAALLVQAGASQQK